LGGKRQPQGAKGYGGKGGCKRQVRRFGGPGTDVVWAKMFATGKGVVRNKGKKMFAFNEGSGEQDNKGEYFWHAWGERVVWRNLGEGGRGLPGEEQEIKKRENRGLKGKCCKLLHSPFKGTDAEVAGGGRDIRGAKL